MIITPGEKFGMLTVIKEVEPQVSPSGQKSRRVLCKCACGNATVVRFSCVKSYAIKSCGCLQKNLPQKFERKYSEGMVKSRLYRIWSGLKSRCTSNTNREYYMYGGRGITVCDEWMNSFTSFRDWAVENGYADNLSIDRIDNNGHYEPANCRWATPSEQQNNTRQNIYLTYKGETHTAAEWSRITGIPQYVLTDRHKYGWSDEKTLTYPLQKRKGRKYIINTTTGTSTAKLEG